MEDNTNNPVPTQPTNPTPGPTPPYQQVPQPPLAPVTPPVPPAPPAAPIIEPTGTPSLPPEPEPSSLQRAASAFTGLFAAIFSWVVFPILIVLILHNFVFQAYHVVGTSMSSTLEPSDYLIISKVGYTKSLIERAFHKDAKYIPARGEIIVFHYPRDPGEVFVKRVIGLPGDRVVIKNGKVTVYNAQNPNGFSPDEKYEPKDSVTLIDTDETVADGSVFVMGDNRSPGGSYDSREWGELQSSYIIGNAVLRLLPLDKAKVL